LTTLSGAKKVDWLPWNILHLFGDGDDLVDDRSQRMDEDDGEAETPKHIAASSMRSSLRSGTMGSLDNDSGEDQSQNNPGGIFSGIAAGGALF
jgi:hypothetical protein